MHRISNSTARRRAAWVLTASMAALMIGGQALADPLSDDPKPAKDPAVKADDGQQERGEIVVTGARVIDEAKKKLEQVAGGVALVDNGALERQAVFTNADFLNLQPGVYAQTASGSDGIKISIRGSAVNRGANFFRSGILFLFDGLPVTGPGGTPYELFEPLGLARTEILRGANAFSYGSSTLGGAINYVTRTGRDAPIFGARVEGGSYGYYKVQGESGGVIGPADYYVSITRGGRDEYQTQSVGNNFGINANVGFQLAPNVETRFFVRYRETFNETPGFLTKAEIEANPRQARPLNTKDPSGTLTAARQNTRRIQPGSLWIANRTDVTLADESALSVGFVYHDYPINIEGGVNQAIWGYSDLSGVLRYQRTDQLFGRDAHLTVGGLVTFHPNDGYQNTKVRIPTGATAGLAVGTVIRRAYYGGLDGNFFFEHESEPLANLHVLLGTAAIRVERSTGVTAPVIPGLTTPFKRSDWYAAPRAGFRWDANDKIQVFGNVSRSVEPHNDWSNLTTPPSIPAGYPASGLAARGLDLNDQKATTYELGVRGTLPILGNLTLSAYRADVRDELLSVEVVPASATTAAITAESNASPTLHQGVELGLTTPLWTSPGNPSIGATLTQSYTYNDFRFKNDRQFGKNRLPGIPEHTYSAQLNLNGPAGFYGSLTTTVASKNWLDYANSVAANSFQVFGASLGWERPGGKFRIFVDFDNITDEHYGAVVSPVYNLRGSDATNPRLTPGDGFTVIGGIAVRF
ncbi:TonB-dependent receptor family protein [Sphingomonas elodea]|uniref:TonB-dependent receptor family protein n=1 Tax=Sphingomonas elodea TaxID=179878 RepID=UPI0002630D0E|nr:TonB-dependent receptor [Sphingomonas elodea]